MSFTGLKDLQMAHTQVGNYTEGQDIRDSTTFCISAPLSHKRAPEGFVMPELCLRHSPAQELSEAVSPCQATAGEGRRRKAPAATSAHTNRSTQLLKHGEKKEQTEVNFLDIESGNPQDFCSIFMQT